MKSKLFVLMLVLFTCLSGSAFADSPPVADSAANQALSKEDLAKMRLALEQLSKNMGSEGSPAPVSSATPPTEKKSTVADVANKALDMMGSAVASVSNNLQKIAPHVWRIMIKQQYAKAAYEVVKPLCLFVGGLIFILVMRKLWKPELILTTGTKKSVTGVDDSDLEAWKYLFRSVVPSIYLVIIGIWLAIGIGTSIKYVINPEYYAVKDILTLVANPNQAPE